ncbi:DUF3859 domain-containing protein [Anabaena sp. FACHB-1237]|uniref:DUF3859 domain-containing protein n=1 Tax=Anabaena sp. FACHB-1237 TaxID=2692769 RepID=UPI001680EC36|nr:DUF3859 domain-containing protein [Anabaena sp. FACHB-1237]MBD2137732.1 DUF3859 domain-containing protein [Anabaena sp. FACHB-1237]
MNQRLNEEELNQIIYEVQSLQLRQESELNKQQVQQILQELNLPPELLDEALIQLRRRQALQVEKSRNKLIIASMVAGVIISLGGWLFVSQKESSLLANVSSQADRITLSSNNSNITNISRQSNSEVFYRVTLKDAPIGKKLSLSCNWIDPTGTIVKQNKYITKEVATSIFDTHCRYTINPSAKVGNWQVQMLLDGRKISDEIFSVE